MAGTWGRIELGDFDGAADTLAIYAPLVGIEQIDGDAYDFLAVTPDVGPRAGFVLGSQPTGSLVQAPNSGDSPKSCTSPRALLASRRASLRHAERQRGAGRRSLQDGWHLQGFLGIRRQLHGRVRGFSIAAGATASTATGQDLDVVGGRSLEDFFAWQAGAQVGYGGFKLGGGYIDAGDYNAVSGDPATSGDCTVWHVGISYTAGPVALASPMPTPKASRAARRR